VIWGLEVMRLSIKLLVCLGTGALVGSGDPTLAGSILPYYISTHTFTEAPNGLDSEADYNYGSVTGSYFFMQGTSTATGTNDNTGTAKYVQDHATGYGTAAGITSNADAVVSLATGSVHLNATDNATCNGACSGSPPEPNPAGIPNFASETAQADFMDTVTFAVKNATSTTVTPITVMFAVDGKFGATSVWGSGNFRSTLYFGGYGGSVTTFNLDPPGNASNPYSYSWVNSSGTGSGNGVWTTSETSTSTPGVNEFTGVFTGVYDLVGATDTLAIILNTSASCGNGFTCDFGDTAGVNFNLPQGVSFNSNLGSGVFLTQSSATPLPAALPLFATGLGAIGLLGRRRKRKNTAALAAA